MQGCSDTLTTALCWERLYGAARWASGVGKQSQLVQAHTHHCLCSVLLLVKAKVRTRARLSKPLSRHAAYIPTQRTNTALQWVSAGVSSWKETGR